MVLERRILCFTSNKNRTLKWRLWWVEARRRKKRALFVPFILSEFFFLTFVFYLNVSLLEYTLFYISREITSYTFSLVFKIAKSLQCILKNSSDQETPLTGCFLRNQLIDFQIKMHVPLIYGKSSKNNFKRAHFSVQF